MQFRNFCSEEEIRNFCSSIECDKYLRVLDNEYVRLHSSEDEGERESSSYIQSERGRIDRLIAYCNGEREAGYRYDFIPHGNGNIVQTVDLSIPMNTEHPAFIKEFAASGVDPRHKGKWFKLWKNQVESPSLNNLFKLAYACKMEELIPNNVTLLKMLDK